MNIECMKKCMRNQIAWLLGGAIISTIIGILIWTGIMFPGAGTLVAVLVWLGLLLFVFIAALIICSRNC